MVRRLGSEFKKSIDPGDHSLRGSHPGARRVARTHPALAESGDCMTEVAISKSGVQLDRSLRGTPGRCIGRRFDLTSELPCRAGSCTMVSAHTAN